MPNPIINRRVLLGNSATSSALIPSVIGQMFTPSYTTGYSTNGNITFTPGASSFDIVGDVGASQDDWLEYDNWYFCTERFTLRTEFIINSIASQAYGLIIGIPNRYGGGVSRIQFGLGMDFGGNLGTLLRYTNGSFIGAAGTITIAGAGDKIRMDIVRNVNVYTCTVTNISPGAGGTTTTSTSYTCSFDYPFTDPLMTQTGKVRWNPVGQDTNVTVTHWSISTGDYTYSDLALIGDSKFSGYCISGTNPAARLADLWSLANLTKRVYNFSGPNDTTNDWVLRLPELQTYKPLKLIIEAPSNDVRFAVAGATTIANIQAIKSAVEAWGGVVYYQNPPPEVFPPGVDLTPLIAIGAGIFSPSNIISVPGTWIALTDNVLDGIHWNVTGNGKVYTNQALTITL